MPIPFSVTSRTKNLTTRKEQSWAGSCFYLPEFSNGELLKWVHGHSLKERLKEPEGSTSSSHLLCRQPENLQNSETDVGKSVLRCGFPKYGEGVIPYLQHLPYLTQGWVCVCKPNEGNTGGLVRKKNLLPAILFDDCLWLRTFEILTFFILILYITYIFITVLQHPTLRHVHKTW